ncbi:Aste57867_20315 [Aphanomyces stellatus]|uniref:Aste57867_20315 protein n=1 Tax=Aphanomyces stellatus TaxID=120398 RepID=A0A485LGP5_9STRA|nr:hypothetical protein As57867_020249 [Aphanomyces stellatus]VFT97004.1 Aste57867_20315 [Aphanomyces stellatus]
MAKSKPRKKGSKVAVKKHVTTALKAKQSKKTNQLKFHPSRTNSRTPYPVKDVKVVDIPSTGLVKPGPRKKERIVVKKHSTAPFKVHQPKKSARLKFQPPRMNNRVPDPNKDANEVLEWLGDAVLDELVGRSLLRHVHIFYTPTPETEVQPVSNLDLFRQLRNALVTNSNLCAVFDNLFPSKYTIHLNPLKMKEKADAVETLVGRVSSRHRKTPEEFHQLDRILSAMMEVEFTQWAVEQENTEKKAFNQFSLLEHLIDTDEEIDPVVAPTLVVDDVIVAPKMEVVVDTVNEEIDENCIEDSPRSTQTTIFHAFNLPNQPSPLVASHGVLSSLFEVQNWMSELLQPSHMLQTSRVMFEIFKLYGMSVLKERVSTCLVHDAASSNPATLTWVRQGILSIDRVAQCASLLQMTATNQPPKMQANTLRAAVGFASAMSSPCIVDAITGLLVYLHQCPQHCQASGCALGTTDTATMDLDELLLHESSTCPHTFAQFINAQWKNLPSVTSLAKLPHSAAATIEFLNKRQIPWEKSLETINQWLPSRWCDLDPISNIESPTRKRKRIRKPDNSDRKMHGNFTLLKRFSHRRFLYCLEEILIHFAKHDTLECRKKLSEGQGELEPCIETFKGFSIGF